MYCMIANIIEAYRRILVKPFDDLGRGDTAVNDIFSMLFEFVENVQRNHKGSENTEKNEEVIYSELPSFYLGHHRIFFEFAYLVSSEHLRLLQHFQVFFSRRFDRMFQHVFSYSQFHIKMTNLVKSTAFQRWIDLLISNLVYFRYAHIPYAFQFVLFQSSSYLCLYEAILLQRRQASKFSLFSLFRSLLYVAFHSMIRKFSKLYRVRKIQFFVQGMLKLIKYFSALIYDLFISTFFTIAAHLSLVGEMSLSEGNFLDVGCGTGKPLKSIVSQIKKKHSKIIGVDITPEYTDKAIQLFHDDQQVEIYNMDFYKIQEQLKLKYRFIFFSFSFMLMPDNLKALEVSKQVLQKNQNSRIAFVLTLNKNKNSLLSWIKPAIKRFTTVDFGNVIYEDDLYSVIDQAGLQVTKKVRVYRGINIFLMFAPVYYIECKMKETVKSA